jgi:enamine deaminase RidA (YjgF/YER057c/UK114 family)
VTDIQRGGSGPYKFSNTVVHNGVVYLAGQVAGAEGFSQPVREQIRLVLGRIDELLESVGSGRDRMLSVTVLLKNIEDFAVLNEEWDAWVDEAHLPARATMQAELASPDILVELIVTAALQKAAGPR